MTENYDSVFLNCLSNNKIKVLSKLKTFAENKMFLNNLKLFQRG